MTFCLEHERHECEYCHEIIKQCSCHDARSKTILRATTCGACITQLRSTVERNTMGDGMPDITTAISYQRDPNEPCWICLKPGCMPLRHIDELLSHDDARRLAQVMHDDNSLSNGRGRLLARYVLSLKPITISKIVEAEMMKPPKAQRKPRKRVRRASSETPRSRPRRRAR